MVALEAPRRARLAAIAIFFGVAIGWSALFARVDALALPGKLEGLPIDDSILVGFGPAVGAAMAMLIYRPRLPTMLGHRPLAVMAAIIAPTATLFVFGMPGVVGGAPHVGGAVFAASVTIYCIGEELGWRGWLHGALGGCRALTSVLVTAALWFAWHWTFMAGDLATTSLALQFAGGLLIGSWGLRGAVNRTWSVGIAVAWHTAVKTLGDPLQIATMLAVIAAMTWWGGRRKPE